MMKSHRKAFSMMMAILVIVMMSSLSVLVMNLSAKIGQSTYSQYQREQAILLAKSYTEYTIMAIMAHDRAVNCLNSITGEVGGTGSSNIGQGYIVNVRISYIGDAGVNNCTNRLANTVVTPESALNAIIDVSVNYRDINNPNIANAQWIRYHKRTLQKI
ncbi:MAG: type II secretion system protein [Sulfurovum sp.]